MTESEPDLSPADKKYSPESRARNSAIGSLAMREHSAYELQQKLLNKNHPEAVVFALITELQKENLLSDARYAESYWRSRSNRGYGPMRIERELEQKGVASRLIQEALYEAEIDFEALVHQVYEKKYKGRGWDDFKEKAKRQNFMYRRGFPSELIRMVVG